MFCENLACVQVAEICHRTL